jgi:AcrR family transcriptional regulator
MEAIRENKKYCDIMHNARILFWKHGFRRVSVEEICKQAKVSKMTFYKFFPDKYELAKAVYEEVMNEGLKAFRELIHSDLPGNEKLKGMIMLKAQGTNNISSEFLADFYNGNEPELQQYVQKRTEQVWIEVIEDIKWAQQEGIFRKDFRPEVLIAISFKMTELLKDERIIKLYPAPQDFILEISNLTAFGISPHKD